MNINCAQTGPGGANTYIVSDENTGKGFIVDPGGYVGLIKNFLDENHIDIQYIILTHGHGDHIGGVAGFKNDFPAAKVVACIHEKELLLDPEWNMSSMMFAKPVTVEADMYVDDGDELKVGDMELKFFHTPGHSPGGMCILVDNVLFSGDTLFRMSIGRTDFKGASFNDLAKSVHEKIFVLPDETQVLPGHMGATTVGDEKKYNPFL
ncbi:MAG: MBL fold metallo-hydrolase [Firmicutes bacterium]|nr:MBL fold metallo-hydrolase [Bacillota bacterium]